MVFMIRHAVRSLVRAPLVSLLVMLCVGLGTGATTTVFAWTEHLIRRPLPAVHSMDGLVTVVTRARGREGSVSYPEYRDWREHATTLRGLSVFGIRQFGLRAANDERAATEATWGLLISENYFDLLGLQPVAGRTFTAAECGVAGQAPVAVISSRIAQRFGGGRSAVGRELRLNDVLFTIVGVTPANFAGTYAGLSFDVWIPVTMQPALGGDPAVLETRDLRWLQGIGRLRDGVSLPEARLELESVSTRPAREHPDDEGREAFVKPLDTGAAQRLRALFTVLLGMTGLVALIVSTNVANLLMLRGSSRAAEIGIRLSLGASRRHVLGQLFVESGLLAVGGATCGLVLSRWTQGLLPTLMPSSPLPLALEGQTDVRTLVCSLVVAAVMVLLFGVAPAIQTLRRAVLPSGGRGQVGGTRGSARLRSGLVVAQLSLSMAALACAGAFLRVNAQLAAVDRGFADADHVLVVSTDLDQAGYATDAARLRASERLVSDVRALPGIRSAAVATFVPLGFTGYSAAPVTIPGYAPRADEDMTILLNRVSADYFRTIGIAIREGRPIDDRDTGASATVAVVNEAFVRRFMTHTVAIGQQVDIGARRVAIVGVAADGKYQFDSLDKPSPPHMYLAYAQDVRPVVTLHVRVDGHPHEMLPAVRRAFSEVNSALPLNGATTLDEYTSLPLFPVRLGTSVLASLGGVALLLASTGLYAVLAYRVAQRWKELAVRIALGATGSSVLRLVLAEGARQALAGVAIGAVLAIGATRLMSLRLPRVISADLPVLVTAAAILSVVALLAACIPAFRATQVDAAVALRGE
jgi:predicted permease